MSSSSPSTSSSSDFEAGAPPDRGAASPGVPRAAGAVEVPRGGQDGLQVERLVGAIRGEAPGPTLIVVGGIHGNEPAGVLAGRRVLERLREGRIPLAGELVVLAGNVGALRLKQRFQVKDLNRQWTEERVAALAARAARSSTSPGGPPVPEEDAEDREQRELHGALQEAMGRARGPVYLVDFHTTSAAGIPFVLYGDTPRHRVFARHFPLPAILGLEELVDGVLVEWLSHRGCVTLVIEAGQHDDPGSIDNLEAALWLALDAAGLAGQERLPEFARSWARLERARGDLPHVMEVLSRHAVTPEHEFRMEPGFANIARTRAGQLLAHDRRGEIRAARDGLLFMPLYQGQGQDGFFLGREVAHWRMEVSHWMRRLRLDVLLPLLPGVRRDQRKVDVLHIDTRIAHLYPLEVFHLFGFRKVRQQGTRLQVARRPH
jgi:predicted deacylase